MLRPILAAAALAILLTPVAAAALPANDVTTTYFADSTRKVVVGEVERTCGGGVISFGRKTKFYRQTSSSCAQARMTPLAFDQLVGSAADKVTACQRRCERRFHRPPELCLPDACPTNDALKECLASCEELGEAKP